MSKQQAPNKEATGRFTVDMSVGRVPPTVDAGGKDGAQESGYCADVVGGWVEGGRRVKAIVLARIKVVKKFSNVAGDAFGRVYFLQLEEIEPLT